MSPNRFIKKGKFIVRRSDFVRYGLWSLIAVTADANRREYHMLTTWFPHFAAYSVIMLLPDLYRAIVPKQAISERTGDIRDDLRQTLDAMAGDNPDYAIYVTPVAVGF